MSCATNAFFKHLLKKETLPAPPQQISKLCQRWHAHQCAVSLFFTLSALLLPQMALAHGPESLGILYYSAAGLAVFGACIALFFIKQPWWVKLLLFFPLVFGIVYLMLIFLIVFWPKGHN